MQPRFWYINIGHVISFCGIAGAALGVYVNYDRAIQSHGAFIATQIETNRVVNDRLKNIETVAPKLERIDEKLNWIQEWIKEQRQNSRFANP